MLRSVALLSSFVVFTGCAGLEFHQVPQEGAMTYRDSVPYMLVTTTQECVTTSTVVSVPGRERSVSFNSGYGTADLSVQMSNGVITSVGQKTDTKIPETISAVAGLAKDVGGLVAAKAVVGAAPPSKPVSCVPTARLYGIRDGLVSKQAMEFPVEIARQ
jgi:hypothetical protein